MDLDLNAKVETKTTISLGNKLVKLYLLKLDMSYIIFLLNSSENYLKITFTKEVAINDINVLTENLIKEKIII